MPQNNGNYADVGLKASRADKLNSNYYVKISSLLMDGSFMGHSDHRAALGKSTC